MERTLVFVGSYTEPVLQDTGKTVQGRGDGITVLQLEESGALTWLSAAGRPNPTYLAVDGAARHVYAVNELKEYSGLDTASVSSYEINRDGTLELMNRCATGGTDACHVLLDDERGYLFIANYGGGSSCVLSLDEDHSIGAQSCFLQHKGSSVDPLRQSGPHAHQAVLDQTKARILVTDLGTDEILMYDVDWDKGHLIPNRANGIRMQPGSGPRHCAFGLSGERLYVITEMSSEILVFSYDNESGAARLLQTAALAEGEGRGGGAAIKLHPSGRWLYASNRGDDRLYAFSIHEDGLLAPVFDMPSGGLTPRDFDISPCGRFLVAAHVDEGGLVVFSIDQDTGALAEVYRDDTVLSAACVVIVNAS